MRQKIIIRTFVVLAFLGLAATLVAAPAEARHRGFRGHIVAPVVHISPYAYWGFPYYGYSPVHRYGPYYGFRGPYREAPRLNPAVAAALEIGAIDFNVKPRKADVFVDGKFVGKVRDLDGSPDYLWLPAGKHTVTIYKGGYATLERELSVEAGTVSEIKLRLVPGESTPPSSAPADKVEATRASARVF